MSKHKIDLGECMKCYCLEARKKAREITRLYDQHLRPYGLRGTQFSVLVALASGNAIPVGKLANALGLERTTLTRNSAVLQRRGWIRSDATKDGRVRTLRITPAGKTKVESAYAGWKAAQQAVQRTAKM
jgi:DNA-binding MarR family transcriptional regulator